MKIGFRHSLIIRRNYLLSYTQILGECCVLINLSVPYILFVLIDMSVKKPSIKHSVVVFQYCCVSIETFG